MTMVDVNSIDSVPGERELLAHAATYIAERLFTPRQRRSLSVLIDVTREPLRVPVTRAMLGPQKAGFGTRPPTLFEMTVSTAGGIRDAAETIAHEMLHISQAVNGRLLVTAKKTKINGRKTMVDMVRWMGGKPLVMDNLALHLRPWEIEACHWQTLLVDEFVGMSTGQVTDQPVQSPKRRQLGLYPVSLPSPAIIPTQPGPVFDGAFEAGESDDASPSGATRQDSNGASIDHVITGAMGADTDRGDMAENPPQEATPHGTQPDPGAAQQAGEEPVTLSTDPEEPADPARSEDDHPLSMAGSMAEPVHNGGQMPDSGTPLAAMPDRPVYPRPVIEVTVPGLDAPRALEREAMTKKLLEFRERGLAAADEAE